MMTIGRRYSGPSRNWAEPCDYCGVTWHRHEMRTMADGTRACPDDADGRVSLEVDMERADAPPPPAIATRSR